MKIPIDERLFDTSLAVQSWNEDSFHDGRNTVSRATGTQWEHEQLHRSRKGTWYLVHSSDWQGSRAWGEVVDPKVAAQWLLLNNRDLPADLVAFEDEAVE